MKSSEKTSENPLQPVLDKAFADLTTAQTLLRSLNGSGGSHDERAKIDEIINLVRVDLQTNGAGKLTEEEAPSSGDHSDGAPGPALEVGNITADVAGFKTADVGNAELVIGKDGATLAEAEGKDTSKADAAKITTAKSDTAAKSALKTESKAVASKADSKKK